MPTWMRVYKLISRLKLYVILLAIWALLKWNTLEALLANMAACITHQQSTTSCGKAQARYSKREECETFKWQHYRCKTRQRRSSELLFTSSVTEVGIQGYWQNHQSISLLWNTPRLSNPIKRMYPDVLTKGIVVLQSNVSRRASRTVQDTLQSMRWEVLGYLPCSLDLSLVSSRAKRKVRNGAVVPALAQVVASGGDPTAGASMGCLPQRLWGQI
jgi:hypothetical protein